MITKTTFEALQKVALLYVAKEGETKTQTKARYQTVWPMDHQGWSWTPIGAVRRPAFAHATKQPGPKDSRVPSCGKILLDCEQGRTWHSLIPLGIREQEKSGLMIQLLRCGRGYVGVNARLATLLSGYRLFAEGELGMVAAFDDDHCLQAVVMPVRLEDACKTDAPQEPVLVRVPERVRQAVAAMTDAYTPDTKLFCYETSQCLVERHASAIVKDAAAWSLLRATLAPCMPIAYQPGMSPKAAHPHCGKFYAACHKALDSAARKAKVQP